MNNINIISPTSPLKPVALPPAPKLPLSFASSTTSIIHPVQVNAILPVIPVAAPVSSSLPPSSSLPSPSKALPATKPLPSSPIAKPAAPAVPLSSSNKSLPATSSLSSSKPSPLKPSTPQASPSTTQPASSNVPQSPSLSQNINHNISPVHVPAPQYKPIAGNNKAINVTSPVKGMNY